MVLQSINKLGDLLAFPYNLQLTELLYLDEHNRFKPFCYAFEHDKTLFYDSSLNFEFIENLLNKNCPLLFVGYEIKMIEFNPTLVKIYPYNRTHFSSIGSMILVNLTNQIK